MSDIIISGYHGFANSGDEALLYAMLTGLRKIRPSLDVTVLSKIPEETASEYGVKSIYRYNFRKIKKEMKNSKMLIFGGGSLLQDVTSSKSILYYLAIIALAKRCGIKIMLYANGIGPITKKHNRLLASRVLNSVDVITLRDDRSDEELKKLKVIKPEIVITADPAFTIDTDMSLSGEFITARAGVPSDTRLCVVSIRDYSRFSAGFAKDMADMCDYLAETYGIYPLFVPMQYPADTAISRNVIDNMKHEAYMINRELSVAEMFSVLSEAEFIVGMRLHSLIYATTLAIPAVALVYDPKVSAFMESLNQPDCVNVEQFDVSKAKAIADAIVKENSQRREMLRETNAVLKKKAEENATYAIKLLENGDE